MLEKSHISFVNSKVDEIVSNYFGTSLFNTYNKGIEKCKGLIVMEFSNDIWDNFSLEEQEEIEELIESKVNLFYSELCCILDSRLDPFNLDDVYNL